MPRNFNAKLILVVINKLQLKTANTYVFVQVIITYPLQINKKGRGKAVSFKLDLINVLNSTRREVKVLAEGNEYSWQVSVYKKNQGGKFYFNNGDRRELFRSPRHTWPKSPAKLSPSIQQTSNQKVRT